MQINKKIIFFIFQIEFWFTGKKIKPLDANHFKEDSNIPQKPKELTPIFSIKISEISPIESNEPEIETIEREDSKVSLKDAKIEEKKEEEIKKPNQISKLSLNKSDQIRPASIREQYFKTTPNESTESKDFDSIWNTNISMPQIQENGNSLPTIGEEFRNTHSKNKSVLDDKLAKANDIEKIINKDTEGSLQENGDDRNLIAKKLNRSANRKEMSDDNIILVDDNSSLSLFDDNSSSHA